MSTEDSDETTNLPFVVETTASTNEPDDTTTLPSVGKTIISTFKLG